MWGASAPRPIARSTRRAAGSACERRPPALSPCDPGETLALPKGGAALASSQQMTTGLAWPPAPCSSLRPCFPAAQRLLVARPYAANGAGQPECRLYGLTVGGEADGKRPGAVPMPRGTGQVLGTEGHPRSPGGRPKGPIQNVTALLVGPRAQDPAEAGPGPPARMMAVMTAVTQDGDQEVHGPSLPAER